MNTESLVQFLATPLSIRRKRELEQFVDSFPIWRWFASRDACADFASRFGTNPALQELTRRPGGVGQVAVPVTLTPADENPLPLADTAAVLPLAWKRGRQHGSGVPASLIAVSELVQHRLCQSPAVCDHYRAIVEPDWCLDWSLESWRAADFHDLILTAESAFAPLTLGLVSAATSVPIADSFLATGCYDLAANQWSVATTLNAKLRAGLKLGYTRFAVPAASLKQTNECLELARKEKSADDAVAIQSVGLGSEQDIFESIQPAREIAGLQPSVDDPPESRQRWYESIRDNVTARKFYDSHLSRAAWIAAREKLAKSSLAGWQPTTLVSIVSNADELLPQAAFVFQPEKMLVFYTFDAYNADDSMKKKLDDFESSQSKWTVASENLIPVPVDDGFSSLDEIHRIVAGIPRANDTNSSSGVLFDVTPGRRTMQMAILEAVCPGDRLFCWWHDTSPITRRVIPLSTEPIVWQVGQDRGWVRLTPKSK